MRGRTAVAVLLLALLALEVVPCGLVREPPAGPSGRGGLTCRFAPLQVCESGDSSLGVLADLPVLVPRVGVFFASPGEWRPVPETGAFLSDGFTPAIDHPPRHAA